MSFLGSIIRPLAYLSLPVLILRKLSARSPTIRYLTRVSIYVGTMSAVAACSVFVVAGMALTGQRYNSSYVTARTFYAIASRLLDIEIEVEGEEHLEVRPAIMMGNHQSMLDVLSLGSMFPKGASMIAKKELRFSPLGPFLSLSGAIFLDRGNNTRAIHSLSAAGESLKKENVSIWIYPEGTRHSQEVPDLLPFKKGGFHLAIQAGIPIIPVVTENYWRLYHKGVFESGKLKVRVLPPISTANLTAADVSALTTCVRDQMLNALREISVKVPLDETASSGPEKPKYEDPLQRVYSQLPATPPGAGAVISPPPSKPREGDDQPGLVGEPPGVSTLGEPSSRGSGESLSMMSASDISNISSPSHTRAYEASENGTETSTEEDEGMVLVGRPV